MIRKLFTLLFMFGLAAEMEAGPAGQSRIPDVIESDVPGVAPAWVAADIALAADGNLRSDLFQEATVRDIRRYLDNKEVRRQSARTEADRDECATTRGAHLEQFSSTASTDNLVTNSSYIINASVADLREGFLFGSPGTLIALDVAEWLKQENVDVRRRPAYLFFPSARISTPHGTICAKPWPPVPTPAKNDHVLLFSYLRPIGLNAAIFQVEAAKQMILTGRAATHLPEVMRRDIAPSSDFAEVVAFVRRHPGTTVRSREREKH